MFTASCFIRKNTPELRKRLEDLGYLPPSKVWYDEDFAICTVCRDNRGEYFTFKIDDDFERIIAPSYPYIDCGTNEELFIAIASLRDDTDINQWFIYNTINNTADKFETIEWVLCKDNNICDYLNWDNCYKYCHKATVEELIEHSKIIEKKYEI